MAKHTLKVGEASDSGLWYDGQSGKIVTSPPAEGRQIIAPGVEATNAEISMLGYFTQVDEPEVKETATAPSAVETATEPVPTITADSVKPAKK